MELKCFEGMYISAQNYSDFVGMIAKAEDSSPQRLEHELRIRDILLREFYSVASPENVRGLYELATLLQQQVIKLSQSLEAEQKREAGKTPFLPAEGPRIPVMKKGTASTYSNCPAFIFQRPVIQLPRGEHAFINGVGMRVLPYNSTIAAIERAGYVAVEAPL